eukprot:360301-Chlamydomonas_euryale.AAC.2
MYADDFTLLADSPDDSEVLLGMVDAVPSVHRLFIHRHTASDMVIKRITHQKRLQGVKTEGYRPGNARKEDGRRGDQEKGGG